MACFLVLTDTPGIKQFVFGTDALAEIRGASALLDRLNRHETYDVLQRVLSSVDARVEKVYANGGSGQFIVYAGEQQQVRRALDQLDAYYYEQTGGEVRLIAGVSPWSGEDADYRQAVQTAVLALQLQRNRALSQPTVPTFPLVVECQSTSYLPAKHVVVSGDERLLLSDASFLKREESRGHGKRQSWQGQLWTGWMEYLDQKCQVTYFAEHSDDLRHDSIESLAQGRAHPETGSRFKGDVGLVYADGNAMGKLVQRMNSPAVYRAFSDLVDTSIRDACYEALTYVCQSEIDDIHQACLHGEKCRKLPADILLLGGDDLLVLLPADRALSFALRVTTAFEEITSREIRNLPKDIRKFFDDHGLCDRGLTISCGVGLAPARYPFYLLLDLAEELLRSAKRGCSRDRDRSDYRAPAYIDFHVLSNAVVHELDAIREGDYLVTSKYRRTLRPYRREDLEQLRNAVLQLQTARLPKSKLQDLLEAALEKRPGVAELQAQFVFSRLRQSHEHPERQSLWQALRQLGDFDQFPWIRVGDDTWATAMADLVEAYDLFGG